MHRVIKLCGLVVYWKSKIVTSDLDWAIHKAAYELQKFRLQEIYLDNKNFKVITYTVHSKLFFRIFHRVFVIDYFLQKL